MNMQRSPILHRTALRTLLAAGLMAGYAASGHAALFGDDEARRAILEMRQRVDSMQQSQQRMTEESSQTRRDRKSTRLNSSHLVISYAVFCLKKKKTHSMVIGLLNTIRKLAERRCVSSINLIASCP